MLPTTKTPPRTSLADHTVLVHGAPKIGKTTFCAQAEGALFLATESGLNSVEAFQVPIASWDQLLAAGAEVAAGKHAFKTIVIDTVDNALRMCSEYVCARAKVEHESDLAYGKGYAMVTNEFYRVLNKLALLPYGLFLISHSQEKEFETRTGKVTRIVPSLPDKARKVVLGMVDIILYADLEATPGSDGKPQIRRVLRTKPHSHFEAGDRTGRLPEVLDLDYPKFLAAFNGAPAGAGPLAGAAPPATAVPPAAAAKAKPESK